MLRVGAPVLWLVLSAVMVATVGIPSYWDSLDSIRAFAGDDVERAVYYPEDERFLIEHDDVVTHWEIFE